MKIVFLLGAFPSLSETFILNQITYFVKKGDQVRILSFRKPALAFVSPSVLEYGLLNKTKYLDTKASKFSRRVHAVAKIFPAFFRHPRLVCRLLKKLIIKNNEFSYPDLFLALHCVNGCPDVVVSHFGPVGVRSIVLKEIGVKAKLVTAFHGYDLSSYLTRNGLNVYEKLFKQGDLFLPISEFWKNKLIALGCPRGKIRVHHMGIESDKFPFVKREYVTTEPFRCLTVSRLVEKKGHMYALEAVSELVRDNQKIVYEIAGDGPLREFLQQRVKELNIEANVVFHGAVQHSQVIQLTAAANCFLLPSVTADNGDMEGIPVVLMEAMATGLPVLSTRHSGIPELITDKYNGVIVPERDSSAIKAALAEIIQSYEKVVEMTENGRKTIKSSFDSDTLNSHLYQIVKDLR